MKHNSSIIFLDIDGVMLPARNYLLPEREQTRKNVRKFDLIAANMLRRLCSSQYPCYIVFNSAWNTIKGDLQRAARDVGLLEHTYTGDAVLHNNDCTPYPLERSRLTAIENWLLVNLSLTLDEANWVALDDATILHKRAIKIDSNNGFTFENYFRAAEILGKKDNYRVLL